MTTQEILDLYKQRWNELNHSCRHGNITVERMHTKFMQLTAQTIEQLAERMIDLELANKGEVKVIEIDSESTVQKILAATGIK